MTHEEVVTGEGLHKNKLFFHIITLFEIYLKQHFIISMFEAIKTTYLFKLFPKSNDQTFTFAILENNFSLLRIKNNFLASWLNRPPTYFVCKVLVYNPILIQNFYHLALFSKLRI